MKPFSFLIALLFLLTGCSKQKVDLIIYNGKIYTVNDKFDMAEAMAVQDGKIVGVGTSEDIRAEFKSSQEVDVNGKAVYPGFIDAHAHFFGYGQSLQAADLKETNSWDEVITHLTDFAKTHPDGWLIGRGWDQNDWADKQFPTKEKLDELFPNRPVFLERIDGHAAIVNQKALDEAGISKAFALTGGDIVEKNGKLTGVLIDNAVGLVQNKIPAPDAKQAEKIFLDAEKKIASQLD